MIRFQRFTQATTLLLFVGLLYFAAYPYVHGLIADLFLRLDPLIAVGTMLAAREFSACLIPGMAVLGVTLIVGRMFCGHVCPMGTTLEILQACLFSGRKVSLRNASYESNARYRGWKYLVLIAITAAASAGISLVYFGSPLSLITRLYGLIAWPIVLLISELGLQLAIPALKSFPDLAYVQIPHKVFATNVFVAVFFAGITALAYWQPRFWCRHLCPAGALMGIFSRSPIIKRDVGESCNRCGQCIRECPTSAIPEDPCKTVHSECIACLKCVEICPQSAISFSRGVTGLVPTAQAPDPTRRGIVLAAASGLFTAGLIRTNTAYSAKLGQERLLIWEKLMRPPGAVPEPEFLVKCVRCGECMKACATNVIQPIWLQAGLEGLFSPVMATRLAACATDCTVCGKVCPTGAIRDLPLIEKQHAKVGTAWVARQNCLVWEQDRKCLVCDEVCPYNAVSFQSVPGLRNAAPFVQENRCTGCGWCESKCPVRGAAAIRVNIVGEVRLARGSYVEKAREYGMIFKTKDNSADRLAPETFDSSDSMKPNDISGPHQRDDNGLPPGFLPR